MVMEIEGTRWTTTSAIAPHNAPFAGLGVVARSPDKKSKGFRVGIRIEGNRLITEAEFNLLLVPVLKNLQLDLAANPRLVIEDSPVWVWRVIRDERGPAGYEAVLATGALKGHSGQIMAPSDCTEVYDKNTGQSLAWKCKMGTPTQKDTAELPRFVEDWSVLVRPANLEAAGSKIGTIRQALREPSRQLQAVARTVYTSVKAVDVPAPKMKGGAAVVTSAAIIGIALAMFTWFQ